MSISTGMSSRNKGTHSSEETVLNAVRRPDNTKSPVDAEAKDRRLIENFREFATADQGRIRH